MYITSNCGMVTMKEIVLDTTTVEQDVGEFTAQSQPGTGRKTGVSNLTFQIDCWKNFILLWVTLAANILTNLCRALYSEMYNCLLSCHSQKYCLATNYDQIIYNE